MHGHPRGSQVFLGSWTADLFLGDTGDFLECWSWVFFFHQYLQTPSDMSHTYSKRTALSILHINTMVRNAADWYLRQERLSLQNVAYHFCQSTEIRKRASFMSWVFYLCKIRDSVGYLRTYELRDPADLLECDAVLLFQHSIGWCKVTCYLFSLSCTWLYDM